MALDIPGPVLLSFEPRPCPGSDVPSSTLGSEVPTNTPRDGSLTPPGPTSGTDTRDVGVVREEPATGTLLGPSDDTKVDDLGSPRFGVPSRTCSSSGLCQFTDEIPSGVVPTKSSQGTRGFWVNDCVVPVGVSGTVSVEGRRGRCFSTGVRRFSHQSPGDTGGPRTAGGTPYRTSRAVECWRSPGTGGVPFPVVLRIPGYLESGNRCRSETRGR